MRAARRGFRDSPMTGRFAGRDRLANAGGAGRIEPASTGGGAPPQAPGARGTGAAYAVP